MTPEIANTVVTDFLKEIGRLLDQAVSIARAAEACVDADNPKQAVEIAMDVESLVFDATTLLNAARLIRDDT
jgi:hypothetical protein